MRLFLVCIAFCFTLTSYSQTYIRSIDFGVGIDSYLVFPYTSCSITGKSGFVAEIGQLDYPTSTNVFFQETIRVRTADFPWFPRIEDIGTYQRRTRGQVLFGLMGYHFPLSDRLSTKIMVGECSDEGWAMKSNLEYALLRSIEDGEVIATVDLHFSTIVTETRFMYFGGYTAKVLL